jgi:predicted nucleic acid-binding protein
MTISIDSNVIAALWDKDPQNEDAAKALDEAQTSGKVVVAGAVYAELLGGYGRTVDLLDEFFEDTNIEIDWRMDRLAWELSGVAYHGYCARRTKRKSGTPRRMLTDFLIGAHAVRYGYRLMTQDKRLFRAAFPELEIIYV